MGQISSHLSQQVTRGLSLSMDPLEEGLRVAIYLPLLVLLQSLLVNSGGDVNFFRE